MRNFQSTLLDELHMRGLLKAGTELGALDGLLSSGRRIAVYAGFDATAESLHAGHLMAILALKIFGDHGHRVLPVVGTATAVIGDPTGRSAARNALSMETALSNADGVGECLASVLGDVDILYNHEWIEARNPVSFIAETAGAVSASRLLSLETFNRRLSENKPLTVLELLYPLLQGYDFLHLSRQMRADGIEALVQVGGSDQWGNICLGIDMISRHEPDFPVFGLTTPLLTKSDGTKMGKTAGGAAWLSPDRLDPQGFFQFWRDMEDDRVETLARLFSVMPEMLPSSDAELNALKEHVAMAACDLVHGAGSGAAAARAARVIFSGTSIDGLPVLPVSDEDLGDLPAILVKAGFAPSKSRARTLIAQGGVRLAGQKVNADSLALPDDIFSDGPVRLSCGRKQHIAIARA